MSQPYPPQAVHPEPQFGPPAYGQPPFGGPGAKPPRNKLLPWLIGMVVALVVALGALAFVLLGADDDAANSTAAASESVPGDEQLGDVDGDAVVPPDHDGPEEQGEIFPEDDGAYTGDGGAIVGSLDRGAAFMDDVVLGDYASALGHGGADFQAYYNGDDSQLADEMAIGSGGALPVNYTIDAIGWDPKTEADILELTVELPDGTFDDLIVLVGEESGMAVVVGFQ
jgi:hypothetical protein